MFVYWAFVIAIVLSSFNGSESRRARIAGGEVSSRTDHPYMIDLRFSIIKWIDQYNYQKRYFQCGGIIISDQIILTAAHCIPSGYRPGRNSSWSSPSFVDMAIHENYKLDPLYAYIPVNDIALLKLKTKLAFNNETQPIKMFEAGEQIKSGSSGIIVGYGQVTLKELKKPRLNDELRSAVVPVVNTTFCAKQYGGNLAPGQICAANEEKHTCSGDSGGPLTVDGKVAGITSWAFGSCSMQKLPDVYTEVAYYRKWIDEKMRQLSDGFKSSTHMKKPDVKSYMVHLTFGSHVCGGAIISENVVLTTARCVQFLLASSQDANIRAGLTVVGASTIHSPMSYAIHENFTIDHRNNDLTVNDIAVIYVWPSFTVNPSVKPIPMVKAGLRFPRTSLGTVIGWYQVFYPGKRLPTNYRLRSVDVNFIDDSICKARFAPHLLKPGQLCIDKSDKVFCNRQMGQPLVVDGQLVGIASWTMLGCFVKLPDPGVYTDVAYYRHWIDDKIKQFARPIYSA